MTRYFVTLMLFLSCLLGTEQSHAQTRHIAAQLVTETHNPAPGTSFDVAVIMRPQPGWHGYWQVPGDTGLSPRVDWNAPQGVEFGALRHPAPELLMVAGIANYVHAGTHVLLSRVTVPANMAEGTPLALEANLEWLACSDRLCVPESDTLRLELTVGNGEPGSDAPIVRNARDQLPKPFSGAAHLRRDAGRVILVLRPAPAIDASRVRFYSDDEDVLLNIDAQEGRVRQGILEINLGLRNARADRISGVLTDGRHSYQLTASIGGGENASVTVEAERPEQSQSSWPANDQRSAARALSDPVERHTLVSTVSTTSFLTALALAVVGGMLLNLMPCVFPILSLKALSLARVGQGAAMARREGAAYLLGTTFTGLILGGAMLAIKEGGADIGWAFQLQDPRLVTILALLTLAIALNLAGLFEVAVPAVVSRGAGTASAFSTGMLASFVATPCSGPFMATALGATMVMAPIMALAVFGGLGIGMGLPFLLVALVPPLRSRFPRPGPWMVTFRRALSLPMIATSIALLWIVGRQAGVDAMAQALIACGTMAFLLWWLGLRQRAMSTALVPLGLIGALVVAIGLVTMNGESRAPVTKGEAVEAFSLGRLEALQREGRPIFVDFTADWCPTCKVNEKVAIERDETRAAFEAAGVVTLIGDWTRGDPAITRYLASRGRNSIPYYLFVDPDGTVEELPQLLTPTLLIERAKATTRSGRRPTS